MNYRLFINNDTIHILTNNETIKLTLLNREGPRVYSRIKKEVYTNTIEADYIEIIDSFNINNIQIWGVKDNVENEQICNWYIDKKEV